MAIKAIKITSQGTNLLKRADQEGAIFPNSVYLLSAIRDGNPYEEKALKEKLKLEDWDDCYEWLMRNNHIEKA